MGMTHQEAKERYQAYRDAAREMYEDLISSLDGEFKDLAIAENATVHFVDGGAYVEAIVWVPLSRLKEVVSHGK